MIHTRNGSDRADGYSGEIGENVDLEDDDDDNADENRIEWGKTTKLVLDIALPFFHTGRVLNMDRYYITRTHAGTAEIRTVCLWDVYD